MVDDAGPACKISLFPMNKRLGRIREVATKLASKPTERAAVHYRKFVTEAVLVQLKRLDVSAERQRLELECFWQMVDAEEGRPSIPKHKPETA